MEHQIVNIENTHLLIVGDDLILANTYLIYRNEIHFCVSCSEEFIHLKGDLKSPLREECKRIIAHLPLNGAPYLDGVDTLPGFSDEVDRLLAQTAELHPTLSPKAFKRGLAIGYDRAKETHRYTEEDMFRMFMFGHSLHETVKRGVIEDKSVGEIFRDRIESISQTGLPTTFEREMNVTHCDRCPNGFESWPKTTIDSAGRTQWVGTYKY